MTPRSGNANIKIIANKCAHPRLMVESVTLSTIKLDFLSIKTPKLGYIGRTKEKGFYKRECQEKCFSLETEERIDSRHSAPFARLIVCIGAFAVRPRQVCSGPLRFASNCLALVKLQQAESVVGVPTMVLSETSGARPGLTAFLGCPRGHRVGSETGLKPNPFVDTHPRTRALHRRGDRRHL